MAKIGDTYTITLAKSHLKWGTHRYTGTRDLIYGEGYIPIPMAYARSYELFNRNGTGKQDILGKNIFNCVSADGTYKGILKAQGCVRAGDVYAKQFSGNKNLKAIGSWYASRGAKIGDKVKVTWLSSTDIEIELI